MEPEVIVTFDNSSRGFILNSLGLKKEGNQLLDSGRTFVRSQNEDKIKIKEFGGVLKGSKVFIKNDSSELVQFFLTAIEKQNFDD